jgi:hypothetical protein
MRQGSRLWAAAVLALGCGLTVYSLTPGRTAAQQPDRPAAQPAQPAQPGGGQAMGVPKYTVVDTQGVNLLVVDNTKNTLYFYTCDRDKEAGEELKLRGSIDLNQVGQPAIKPKGHPGEDDKGKPREPRDK